MKVLLTLAYDGTNYAGWQSQQNAVSVQDTVGAALTKLYGFTVDVLGASRTDAGVHALGQRAAFTVPDELQKIPISRIPYALNTFLPPDITAVAAESVDDVFHPIFGAKRKTYRYKIWNSDYPNPLERRYTHWVREKLDIPSMQEATRAFIGTHDFAGFCSVGSHAKTTVRTIYDLNVTADSPLINITVTGGGFLYNMVRIIAGTLILVGRHKIQAADMPKIIASTDRSKAGPTAPASGLTLLEIIY